MSVVVEKYGSESLTAGNSGASREMTYLAIGYYDGVTAGAAVESFAPAKFGALPRVGVDPKEVEWGLYEVTVRWSLEPREPRPDGQQPPGEEPEQLISFNLQAGTTTVFQSSETVGYGVIVEGSPTTAPDFAGAIGVTKTGVEGAEIVIPQMEFNLRRTFAAGWLTFARLKAIHDLIGTTNANQFGQFAAGEVLFMGATTQQRSLLQPVTVDFAFRASPNVTNLQVGTPGNRAIVTSKKGWQYLWLLFDEYEDDASKTIVKKLRAAYVETVYKSADWSGLGVLA